MKKLTGRVNRHLQAAGAGFLADREQALDWALAKLYTLAENGEGESTRLKATELVLRTHGELVSRHEVAHVDSLDSQEDLMLSILDDLKLSYHLLETGEADDGRVVQ